MKVQEKGLIDELDVVVDGDACVSEYRHIDEADLWDHVRRCCVSVV